MSDTHAAPVESKKTDSGAKEEKEGGGIPSWLWIVCIIVIVITIVTGISSSSSDQNAEDLHDKINHNTPAPTTPVTYPPIEQAPFEINGSLSEVKYPPAGYTLTFVCDQPYQIVNAKGKEFNGEANQDVDIGTYDSNISTENLRLRFRTRNGTVTKMKIVYSPMVMK